jgi:uncharacterized membrane protein YdbT with pleckstrin-like domain
MQPVRSVSASQLPPEQLRVVLANYLALDRDRLRRLLVARLAAVALVVVIAETLAGVFPFAQWISLGVGLLPLAGIWAGRALAGLASFSTSGRGC